MGWGVFGFAAGYVHEEGFASGNGFKLLWLVQQATGPLRYGAATYLAVATAALGALGARGWI